MNEYLPTTPFDIYELHLFQLVAQHRSFTKAAEVAGLTQSAVTRQVQGIEAALGLELFERTTRSVQLTPAGLALCRQSIRLLGDIDQTLKNLREAFTELGVALALDAPRQRVDDLFPSQAADRNDEWEAEALAVAAVQRAELPELLRRARVESRRRLLAA